MHPKHLQRWILLTLAAILIMVGLAVGSKRPDLVQTIPGFGPTATPTPLASENISSAIRMPTRISNNNS